MLRPVLPGLADETIAAIAREVPDYAGAMEGEFGQVVRRGVEVAFTRFVDLLADPEPDAGQLAPDLREPRPRRVPRGAQPGRAAGRLPRRRAARVAALRGRGRRRGLSADALYALGEAIFAYIDELSAESAEGFAEEQSLAAGESDRRRRRLVRLLVQEPAPRQRRGAQRRRGGRLAAAAPARGARARHGRRRRRRRGAARLPRRARRPPAGRGGGRRRGGRRRRRADPRPRRARPPAAPGVGEPATASVALGPDRAVGARGGQRAAGRPRPTGSPPPAGCRAAGWSWPRSTWSRCCSRPTRGSPASSPERSLAPLDELAEGPRERLRETLARLARPPRAGAGGRRGARRAPADGALPHPPAARPVRRPPRGSRGAVRARARPARGLSAPGGACYH